MQDSRDANDQGPAPLRSAAEATETKPDELGRGDEGGHMSSTSGRVMHVAGAELPYVVVLSHHDSAATEHAFATMREAEAFIKRNTPVPGRPLSRLYDRAAGDS